MGHANQFYFATRWIDPRKVRKVVEIGSKDYGSTVPWRKVFKGAEYVGTDLEAGPGVDVVADVTKGIDGLPTDADLVICCSVLEHVERPWIAAENLMRLLKPGGVLYIATPWVWRYHPYPDDYFRFSFNGIRSLFPGLEWVAQEYSTNKNSRDFIPAVNGSDNALAVESDGVKYLPYLELHSLGVKSGN